MIPIVSAADQKYLPGLKALHNSFKANASKEYEFFAIVDDDLFDEVVALGINAIKPVKWTDVYPLSGYWPVAIPALFAPLQIPLLFKKYEKAIWIDADCIIVDSLSELGKIEFKQPVAALRPNNKVYVLDHLLENCPDNLVGKPGLFGGLMVYNVKEWNKRKITQKCAKAMALKDITFKWCDQSVLSYVLAGDFHELSMIWQTFAHRANADMGNARILHWLGKNPWEAEVRNKYAWEKYA